METKEFQFDVIINDLDLELEYLCYGWPVNIYFYSFSAGTDCRRQILTSTVGPRAERVDHKSTAHFWKGYWPCRYAGNLNKLYSIEET